MLREPSPDTTGGIVDQRDELASWTAILQPAERRAILHQQLPKTGSAFAPYMHGLHTLGARAPQSRLGHPLPQPLPAHAEALLCHAFAAQRVPEIRITLAQARENFLLQSSR